MTGGGPVRALLRARWQTIRPAWARRALLLPLALLPLTPVIAVLVADALPRTYADEVLLLLPAGITGLLITSVLSPLLVGGGFELIPEAQLVAYPLRARTRVTVSLLLAPLNLAWLLQALVLVATTAYVADGPLAPWAPAGIVLLLAGTLGCLGLAAAWALLGWARTPVRRAVAGLVTTAVVVLVAWRLRDLALVDVAAALGADKAAAAVAATAQEPLIAAGAAVLLVLVALAGRELAVGACSWALRRPVVRLVRADDKQVRRRAPRRGGVAADLRAMDRASAWRSVPIRRGLIVITATPAVLGLLAPLDWSVLTLFPPLVATGAGLIFAVNSFALDGGGALWRASLPGLAALALAAKARVATETIAGSVLLTLAAALVRVTGPVTPTTVLCLVASAGCCVGLVVSRCLRWSVVHPYRADLAGPRDTPAPPGALAAYSLRLAALTCLTGTAFTACLLADSLPGALVVTTLAASAVAWSWRGTARRYADPLVRAHVTAVVAAG